MEIASIIEGENLKLSLRQCLIWFEIFELNAINSAASFGFLFIYQTIGSVLQSNRYVLI